MGQEEEGEAKRISPCWLTDSALFALLMMKGKRLALQEEAQQPRSKGTFPARVGSPLLAPAANNKRVLNPDPLSSSDLTFPFLVFSLSKVAIKLVHRSKTPTTAARVRSLWNEMRTLKTLPSSHPSIIIFESFIISPSYALVVMPYLERLMPVNISEVSRPLPCE